MPIQRSSRVSVIVAGSIAFFLVLGTKLQRSEHLSLLRQTGSYRAPLLSCHLQDTVEGSYCVFLHHGCSFEQHKRTVGERPNFNSSVTSVFPETANHGMYYCTDEIGDEAIEDIRADIAVDMVECEVRAHLSAAKDGEVLLPDELRKIRSLHRPYQAPLIWQNHPHHVKGSYIITLHPGHSFADHKRTVGSGADLNSTVYFVSEGEAGRGARYFVDSLSSDGLEAIRADMMVDAVKCTWTKWDATGGTIIEPIESNGAAD